MSNGFPSKLTLLLEKRKAENNFRKLSLPSKKLVDFSSNDYLGFSKDPELKKRKEKILKQYQTKQEGSTGARLISGNSLLAENTEKQIAKFHNADAALLFNSGYDANTGLLSSVPQKRDLVLYDELCHSSIIDGVRQSFADSFKFRHNDVAHLQRLLERNSQAETLFVVTESVFSMDGDCALLKEISALCNRYGAYLIVDEAHATGVYGSSGRGLCNAAGIEKDCFARVYTFGKALGTHGAAVVGGKDLKDYLVNFARSFIYTTALPPSSLASAAAAYSLLKDKKNRMALEKNIKFFNSLTAKIPAKISSTSAIHCFLVPGNENAIKAAESLQNKGFDVRPIKSPTVRAGSERLRICLHATNTSEEIRKLAVELKSIFC
ncbi:MAG: aminotransferase class I/II-fold pyridoxal phosphate-dependent enzyme [Bacteroidia bacterium]